MFKHTIKFIQLAICFVLFDSAYAQNNVAERILNQAAMPTHANVLIEQTNPESITQYQQSTVKLMNKSESKIGKHYYYQQTHNGIPVYGAFLKINTNHKGVLLNSFNTLVDLRQFEVENISTQTATNFWVINGNKLTLTTATHSNGIFSLTNKQGEVLFTKDTRLYFTDTTIKAKVFNPDPLTTAGVAYGHNNTYKHFNDSDYALINNQLQTVTMPARFINDTFRLENKYAKIVDFGTPGPVVEPAKSITDSFMFTRKQTGFKDVMVLYHIYGTQQFLSELGYDSLVNYQLRVDAHATQSDQSFFTFEPDTTLSFGLGGVPDAEDADVIVHEYTHAIVFSLNTDGILTTERRSIEEGMCDAMCCAYSKRLNTFGWKKIFNWDGHNEFWNGRDGASTKTYQNKIGDVYSDSEIWSSAMNNISEALGENVCIKLILAVVPQLNPSSTMKQVAHLMYDADSILNGGVNRWFLANEFNYRQFDSFPTGLIKTAHQLKFSLNNSEAFAHSTGNAVIQTTDAEEVTLEIFNLQGALIKQFMFKHTLQLNPNDFSSGLLIVKLKSNNKQGYIKLIKY